MRTIPTKLGNQLKEGTLHLATCAKVTRQDGTILGFTDHDRDLLVNGVTYQADAAVDASTVSYSSGTGIDNLEVVGILDSNVITATDILAGRYDHPKIEIFLVTYAEQVQSAQLLSSNGDHFNVIDDNFFLGSDRTFSLTAMVKFSTIGSGQTILGRWESSGGRREFYLIQDGIGVLRFAVSGDGSAATQVGTTAAIQNKWHLLVAYHDHLLNDIGLSIDGATYQTNSHSTGINAYTGNKFRIGVHDSSSNYLNGQVAFIRAWDNRKITQSEVTELWNNGQGLAHSELPAGLLTNLSGSWDMSETGGQRADSSGNGNHLEDASGVSSTAGLSRLLGTTDTPITEALTLFSGFGGEVRTHGDQFVLEIRSLMQKLRQQIGRLASQTCRVRELGDIVCAPNKTAPALPVVLPSGATRNLSDGGPDIAAGSSFHSTPIAYTMSKTVSLVTSPTVIEFGTDSTLSNDWYTYGTVEFTTGPNVNFKREVKKHEQVSDVVTITLQEAFPFAVSVGEVATMVVGCNRTYEECQSDKFRNERNFDAEPHLPGTDQVIKVGRP